MVFAASLLASQLIQAQVCDDPVNPCIKRTLKTEVADVSVSLQESFLVNILGVVLAPGQVQSQAQNLVLILPHQRIKGGPRTRLCFADELHLRSPRLQALLSALSSVHRRGRSHTCGGLYPSRSWPCQTRRTYSRGKRVAHCVRCHRVSAPGV